MTAHEIMHPPRELGFSTRTQDGCIIATLSGDLDTASAPVLREQLLSALGTRASRLVIDLSNVSFCALPECVDRGAWLARTMPLTTPRSPERLVDC